jgi:hypothetical protein
VRICIIGKFPPIQGGISMRTYWSAQGLAALGHEVHVVTNAKEAVAPFRMLMRAEDWERCAATCDSGSVTVHWTDPVDRSQSYIPIASSWRLPPFSWRRTHQRLPLAKSSLLVAALRAWWRPLRLRGRAPGRP